MSNKNIIKTIIHDYFIIFACCIMFVIILNPDYDQFTAQNLRYAMLCSAAASLPSLILFYPRECSDRYEKLRVFLHFAVVEVIVFIFASVMNWAPGLGGKIVIVVEVAVIYAILKALSYRGDKKTADQINEKLRLMKNQEKNHMED